MSLLKSKTVEIFNRRSTKNQLYTLKWNRRSVLVWKDWRNQARLHQHQRLGSSISGDLMRDIYREESLHRYEDKWWATPKRQWGAVSIFPTRQDDPKKVIRLPSRCNGSVIPTTSCLSTSWLLLEHGTYSGRRMKWRTSRARGIRVHDWNPTHEQEHDHDQEPADSHPLIAAAAGHFVFSKPNSVLFRETGDGTGLCFHLASRNSSSIWKLVTPLNQTLTARISFWISFAHPF